LKKVKEDLHKKTGIGGSVQTTLISSDFMMSAGCNNAIERGKKWESFLELHLQNK
jgi:hypothetical protein